MPEPNAKQYTSLDENTQIPQPTPLNAKVQLTGDPTKNAPPGLEPKPGLQAYDTSDSFLNAHFNNYVRVLSAHYSKAEQDIADDFEYFNAATGRTTYEEVKNRIGGRTALAENTVRDAEMLVSPDDWIKYVYPLVDSLPYVKKVSEAGAVGSMTGGLSAGGVGMVIGGPALAGTTGGLGIVWGGPAGAFTFAAAQGTGRKYKELRDAGVPDARARQLAASAGLVHGAIESAQTLLVTRGMAAAFKTALKTEAAKKLMGNAVVQFAKNAGLEGLEESSDTAASMLIDQMAANEFDIAALKHKDKEWVDNLVQSFLVGAVVGGTLRLAGEGAGKLAGAGIGKLVKGKGTLETTGKANWADDLQQVLKMYGDATKPKTETDIEVKPELAVTLKQALAQAEAAAAKRLSATIEVTESVSEPGVTQKSNLEQANDEVSRIRDDLKKVRAEKKELAGSDKQEDVDRYKALLEEEKTLESELDAAKLDVAKWQLEERLNGDISEEERAKINARVEEIRAEHRKIKKRIAKEQALEKIDGYSKKVSKHTEEKKKVIAKHLQFIKDLKEDKTLSKAEKKQLKKEEEQTHRERLAKLDGWIESANKKIDALKSFVNLIDTDLLSVKQVNQLQVTLRAGDIDTLMKAAFRAVTNTARDIAWSRSKSIKENQNALKALIKHSGLSKEDQAGFLAQLPNIQSNQDLRSAVEDRIVRHKDGSTTFVQGIASKIDAVIEQRAKQEQVDKLYATVKASKPVSDGVSTKSKFGFSTKIQDVFDVLHNLLNPTREIKADGRKESLSEARNRVIAKAQSDYTQALADTDTAGVDYDLELNALLADFIGDLDSKSSSEVKSMVEALSNMSKDGRLSRALEVQAFREKVQTARNEFIQALAPGKSKEDIDYLTRPQGALLDPNRDSVVNRAKRRLKTFGMEIFSWDGKLDIALQKLNAKLREALKDKLDASGPEIKKQSLNRRYLDSLVDSISSATGLKTKDILSRMFAGSNKKISIEFINGAGNSETLNLSVSVAQDMLAQMRDPDLKDGLLHGNGFTFKDSETLPAYKTTEGALERALENSTPGGLDLKIVDGVMAWYQKMYLEAAAEYRAATGRKLDKNPFYSGVSKRARKDFEGTSKEMLADMNQRFSNTTNKKAAPTFSRKRLGTTAALHFDNIYTKANSYAAQLAHWRSWREQANFIDAVLRGYEVRTLMKLEYGDGFVSALNAHLHDMAVASIQRKTNAQKHVDRFLNRMAPLVLLGKPLQYPKQLTGFISGMMELSPTDLISGVVEFHMNPMKSFKQMADTDYYKNRYDNNYSTWMGAITEKDAAITRDAAINKFLGIGLIGGDKHVSTALAFAKFKAELKNGADTETAMKRAWQLVERTQSSSRKDQLSNLARDPVFKIITIFKQQPTRAAEYRLTALRDMLNGTDTVANFLQKEMAARFAQAAFVAIDAVLASWLSTDEDEKEKLWRRVYRELAYGPIGPLSDVVSYLSSNFEKHLGVKDVGTLPQHPVLQAVQYVGKFNDNLLKAIEQNDLDSENMLRLSILYAKGYYRFFGPAIPIEPVLKTLRLYFNVVGETVPDKKKLSW